MLRKMMLAVLVVLAVAAIVMMAVPERAAVEGPDTSSANWRYLGSDAGVLLRHDDRLGYRGRLYVKVDGAWQPVALDGLGELNQKIPIK
jgi:hypothetical protein